MSNNMADKLKTMLEDPATLGALSEILGSIQAPSSDESSNAISSDVSDSSAQDSSQSEAISKIKQILQSTNIADDTRINLLNSLKPYMRQGRLNKMEQAIRLIQISKMTTLFKP